MFWIPEYFGQMTAFDPQETVASQSRTSAVGRSADVEPHGGSFAPSHFRHAAGREFARKFIPIAESVNFTVRVFGRLTMFVGH